MARNEEKAMAMLNRWVTMKKMLATGIPEERPNNPAKVASISGCEVSRGIEGIFQNFEIFEDLQVSNGV